MNSADFNNTVKDVVLDWPLNIYTYVGCKKEFPQNICKIFTVLNHSMCEYFNFKVGTSGLNISMELNGDL